MAPGDMDFSSRDGYGRNKAAAENVLLDSGLPVSTYFVHRRFMVKGARPPRTWVFVKRVPDRREAVLLAGRGRGVDHPSAAVNIAALVETVAAKPGIRILNAADPDAPRGADIARVVARHLGHAWRQVLLDGDVPASLGWHPWESQGPPLALDMSAALDLGYLPVGDFAGPVPDDRVARATHLYRRPRRWNWTAQLVGLGTSRWRVRLRQRGPLPG